MCGGQMRLIAFITEGAQISRVREHIGVESEPPRIAPARGPPLWQDCDAQVGEGVQFGPDWDLAVQPALDYEVDQRVVRDHVVPRFHARHTLADLNNHAGAFMPEH